MKSIFQVNLWSLRFILGTTRTSNGTGCSYWRQRTLSSLEKNTAWISSCFYTFTSPCKAHCHQRVWCHPTAAVRPTLCAAEIPRAQHSAAAKAFCWHLLKAREGEKYHFVCLPSLLPTRKPAQTALCSSAWETRRLGEQRRHLEPFWPFQHPMFPLPHPTFFAAGCCCLISLLSRRLAQNSSLLCFFSADSHLPKLLL